MFPLPASADLIEPLSGRYFEQHRARNWKAVFTRRDERDRCHNAAEKAERSHVRSERVTRFTVSDRSR
jgi:hypothetical protein